MSDIEKYEIKIYEFPICDDSDDDQFKKIDEDIRVKYLLDENLVMNWKKYF
jgi:hypothetical protein